MPYNTTAIPPRKEVTGQTQLPLTRVKKIIGVDPDITICSNNAAFVITLATEMFIQHLATEAQGMAKQDRKPRRNIQYKDLANTVAHNDNLEFLEDIVPRTTPFKSVKVQAALTRAKLKGEKSDDAPLGSSASAAGGPHDDDEELPIPNGKKQKSAAGSINGTTNGIDRAAASRILSSEEDPNAQLEMEMRQAHLQQSQQNGDDDDDDDDDVDMTG